MAALKFTLVTTCLDHLDTELSLSVSTRFVGCSINLELNQPRRFKNEGAPEQFSDYIQGASWKPTL